MAIWNGIEQRSVLYYTWAAAGARPLLVYRTLKEIWKGNSRQPTHSPPHGCWCLGLAKPRLAETLGLRRQQ